MKNCNKCIFSHFVRNDGLGCYLCEHKNSNREIYITHCDNGRHYPLMSNFQSTSEARNTILNFRSNERVYHVVVWDTIKATYVLLKNTGLSDEKI